ncbi:sirohydrochlorin cobaltochelatase [Desulfovibrio subterraneus]|uniref:sirohydrochlorin cobaltochelatase n=1 Tax=Desulfovibrio subterraneus TaxID=2718620 RepID=UPI0022B8B918|nr:sirohydrochlorin cobaltochelatase [Desulfovibrio subterraneus]WBF68351.1 sirohydrochlorin cobaltochelatase [Desulfovibrio subterraneus]
MKRGILLVVFGANSKQANDTLSLVDDRVRSAFPGVNVRWAFTSELIRDRLAEQRVKTDSVRKALEKMGFEKYTHVAVQSLHIIPGAEYEDLLADGEQMRMQKRLQNVVVGSPLLHTDEDVQRAAEAMLCHLPALRQAGDAVVFMGHGTWHSGDSRYEDLSRAVRSRDEGVFIGTMDGSHTIEDILPALKAGAFRRVWLLPLLSVVGRHARKDMAGEGPDSWKSHIEAAGFECLPVLVGVAEYPGFVDIWIRHLGEALRMLESE